MLSIFKNVLVNFQKHQLFKKCHKMISEDAKLTETELTQTMIEIAHGCIERNFPLHAVLSEIASFLINSGHPEIAESYYELSLAANLNPSTYSLYLQGLLLNPACTEEKMYNIASQYDKLFLSHIKKSETHSNDLTPHRKLNIGYICHFFHNSVARSSLIPFLKAHNHERVKIFCYSDADPTEVPDYIKAVPDEWRDTRHLHDGALASLIREDKIDILLELNGHCVVNRYTTIASKPAPIQISYYNIATTTGISAIDYLITGEDMALDKSHPYYTESMYVIKGVTGVIKFPEDFPEGSLEPPCFKNKFITFGSFGQAHKVNHHVIKLWCNVLKQIPDAKFYMKANVLSHKNQLNSFKRLFILEGINPGRIHFEGFSEHHEMLKRYSQIDIALDTFPHCGGTTTMEASWQGVPVLTLYGNRHSMRDGNAILSSIGHPELVAHSEEDFISKAKELATDPNRLLKYRQQLRIDFKNSSKTDEKTFAANLEDAYYAMWKKYCQNQHSIKDIFNH